MLASLLTDKLYAIEVKLGLLLDYLQNNKRSEWCREQQYIVDYLSDIVLVLTKALYKGKRNLEDSMG